MTDEEARLRAVEIATASGNAWMEHHEQFCTAMLKQTRKDFELNRKDHEEMKSGLRWVNRWLVSSLFSFLLVAIAAYLKYGVG